MVVTLIYGEICTLICHELSYLPALFLRLIIASFPFAAMRRELGAGCRPTAATRSHRHDPA